MVAVSARRVVAHGRKRSPYIRKCMVLCKRAQVLRRCGTSGREEKVEEAIIREEELARIDAQPWNKLFLKLFRTKMAGQLGVRDDDYDEGYRGMVKLARELNARPHTRENTQAILRSLFPSWLPAQFATLFARPFPAFSAKLNAYATLLSCQWLMGPSKLVDVDRPDGTVGIREGIKVQRCRYLEESGCVGVCLNSCKLPTQDFFRGRKKKGEEERAF